MTPEAFKIKVLHFKNRLYRYCLRMLNDHDEANDAVQEVYLKLWTMKDRLNTYDNPDAYAMKMARNHCLDQLKASRRQNVRLSELEADVSINTGASFDDRDMTARIKSLIDQLPELQRSIIHLRDIEQYTIDEIELITGLNPNAIRVNLSRARKKIRDKIEKYQHHEYQ